MIRHVVVISWKPEATAEQKQQVSADLATLPALMHGLTGSRAYVFGSALKVTETNADFAIVADFDSRGSALSLGERVRTRIRGVP
jgi:hypothetical protein